MAPPNIVLVMTDEQRWDTLACLGHKHVRHSRTLFLCRLSRFGRQIIASGNSLLPHLLQVDLVDLT